jgi:uncharacterized membrane protein YeaQ/YmgE (transglycosylase-associated protein family)
MKRPPEQAVVQLGCNVRYVRVGAPVLATSVTKGTFHTALRGIIADPDFSQDRAMMAQRFGPPAVLPPLPIQAVLARGENGRARPQADRKAPSPSPDQFAIRPRPAGESRAGLRSIGLPLIARLDCDQDSLYSSWRCNVGSRQACAARLVVGRTVMTIESVIIWLIIGAIAGWLAGLIVKGYGFGLIGNIVVGIVGAVIAGWLLPRIGFALGGGIVAAIINAVIGAVILLLVIGLFKRAP